MNDSRLTIKQKKFIEHYAITGNGAESARVAGYSHDCDGEIAYENLKKPHIKKEIEIVHNKYIEKMKLDKEFVLSRLIEWAKQDDPKLANASIKSLELLGKYLRLWNDDDRLKNTISHEEALKLLE